MGVEANAATHEPEDHKKNRTRQRRYGSLMLTTIVHCWRLQYMANTIAEESRMRKREFGGPE